jgi:hypothetical protein
MKAIVLLSLLLTSCATSQWAFRNANDRKVRTTEKIVNLDNVSLTEDFLLIAINTKHISGSYEQTDKRQICFDRIAFSPNKEENFIPVNSLNFSCPQVMKVKNNLVESNSNNLLIVRFGNVEKTYTSSKPIFHGKSYPVLLNLKDGLKNEKTIEGNKLYYALVPFTFVFDIITAPIQWGIFIYEMRKMNMKHKGEK